MRFISQKAKWIQIVSYVIIALLTVEVFLLFLQNRKLKQTIEKLTGVAIEPLKPGDKVEPFKILTPEGDTTDFNYSEEGNKYLLFILSTTCPYCEKNLVHWRSIVESNKNNNNYIFGVSIDDQEKTDNYITTKDVSFYTVIVADTAFRQKYKIAGVPTTILIDGNGIVEKVWIGVLTNEQTEEIKNLLNARKGRYLTDFDSLNIEGGIK